MSIFIDLHPTLLLTHPTETFIDTFEFAFGKLTGFIVTEELLGYAAFGFFLGQTLGAHIVLICYHGTNLEILGQLL